MRSPGPESSARLPSISNAPTEVPDSAEALVRSTTTDRSTRKNRFLRIYSPLAQSRSGLDLLPHDQLLGFTLPSSMCVPTEQTRVRRETCAIYVDSPPVDQAWLDELRE